MGACQNRLCRLPAAISYLTHLAMRVVYPGKIMGTIPASYGFLPRLCLLVLANNYLSTGPIPISFANLTLLGTLDLGYKSLAGGILEEVARLPALEALSLPATSCSAQYRLSLRSFLHLDFYSNAFSCGLPITLVYLHLSSNAMSGMLDRLNVSFPDLQPVDLDLSMNSFNGAMASTLLTDQCPHLGSLYTSNATLSHGRSRRWSNPGNC